MDALVLTSFVALLINAGFACADRELKVAIDVGHGKGSVGATSATGIGEYYFNEKIAQMLLSQLIKDGHVHSFIINEGGKDVSLNARPEIANRMKADLFISIHHDSVQPIYLSPWTFGGKARMCCDRYHGFSVFYSEENADPANSLRFARLLGNALVREGLTPTLHHAEKIKGESRQLIDLDLGIYRFDELRVLRTTKMPAILLECGIIVNREEEGKLKDPQYQSKIVDAIASSINAYGKGSNGSR